MTYPPRCVEKPVHLWSLYGNKQTNFVSGIVLGLLGTDARCSLGKWWYPGCLTFLFEPFKRILIRDIPNKFPPNRIRCIWGWFLINPHPPQKNPPFSSVEHSKIWGFAVTKQRGIFCIFRPCRIPKTFIFVQKLVANMMRTEGSGPKHLW